MATCVVGLVCRGLRQKMPTQQTTRAVKLILETEEARRCGAPPPTSLADLLSAVDSGIPSVQDPIAVKLAWLGPEETRPLL